MKESLIKLHVGKKMQEACLKPYEMATAGTDTLLGAYVQGSDLVVKFGDLREARVPSTTFDYEINELKISTNALMSNGKNIKPKILDYLISQGFFDIQLKLYKVVRERGMEVSNKGAKSLIKTGKVFVNDVEITDPDTLIKQSDYIEVKDVVL